MCHLTHKQESRRNHDVDLREEPGSRDQDVAVTRANLRAVFLMSDDLDRTELHRLPVLSLA